MIFGLPPRSQTSQTRPDKRERGSRSWRPLWRCWGWGRDTFRGRGGNRTVRLLLVGGGAGGLGSSVSRARWAGGPSVSTEGVSTNGPRSQPHSPRPTGIAHRAALPLVPRRRSLRGLSLISRDANSDLKSNSTLLSSRRQTRCGGRCAWRRAEVHAASGLSAISWVFCQDGGC